MNPPPDLVIEGMPHWRSFAVYAWRRQGVYLYVGVTAKGYRRPFCSHGIIGVTEPIQDGDKFDFWFFLNLEDAGAFEATMIDEHRPPYNQVIPSRNSHRSYYTRKCLGCQKFLPKQYSLWLCGDCERLKILRTANRLVRQATEEWNKAEGSVEWRQSWDAMYACQKRTCAACKQPFVQEVWWQAFCSAECSETKKIVQVDSLELAEIAEWATGRRY